MQFSWLHLIWTRLWNHQLARTQAWNSAGSGWCEEASLHQVTIFLPSFTNRLCAGMRVCAQAWFWSKHQHQIRRAHQQTLKIQTLFWLKGQSQIGKLCEQTLRVRLRFLCKTLHQIQALTNNLWVSKPDFDWKLKTAEATLTGSEGPNMILVKTSTWNQEGSPADPEGPNMILLKKTTSH